MSTLVTIGEAAEALGLSMQTIRRWEREGKIPRPIRTPGNQRRYDLEALKKAIFGSKNP